MNVWSASLRSWSLVRLCSHMLFKLYIFEGCSTKLSIPTQQLFSDSPQLSEPRKFSDASAPLAGHLRNQFMAKREKRHNIQWKCPGMVLGLIIYWELITIISLIYCRPSMIQLAWFVYNLYQLIVLPWFMCMCFLYVDQNIDLLYVDIWVI